jgi:hypothetical protein
MKLQAKDAEMISKVTEKPNEESGPSSTGGSSAELIKLQAQVAGLILANEEQRSLNKDLIRKNTDDPLAHIPNDSLGYLLYPGHTELPQDSPHLIDDPSVGWTGRRWQKRGARFEEAKRAL